MADDSNGERTAWVRIGYALTGDGRVDTERVGTVEEMPYHEAKQFVRDGRGQFVDGPDAAGEAAAGPVVKELAEPLVAGAADPAAGFVRTRRNNPETVRRMGAWGAAPVEKPDADPGDVATVAPAPAETNVPAEASTVDAPATEPATADVSTVDDTAITTNEQE